MEYEVLFYNGWVDPPAYYLVTAASGDSPEDALQKNLAEVTHEVRKLLGLDKQDISDVRLQETIYLLRADSLVPVRTVHSSRKRTARKR
ncbi:MAG: hypothetical protein HY868_02220 [Chloroflexi bacterium]|nr:hypothetical protein [Chloroflexota bacterium]